MYIEWWRTCWECNGLPTKTVTELLGRVSQVLEATLVTVDLHLQRLELGPDGSKHGVDLGVLSSSCLEVALQLGDFVGLDFLEGVLKLADSV